MRIKRYCVLLLSLILLLSLLPACTPSGKDAETLTESTTVAAPADTQTVESTAETETRNVSQIETNENGNIMLPALP